MSDPQLVSELISSSKRKSYLSRMAMEANYTLTNRPPLLHATQKVFSDELSIPPSSIRLLRDLTHHIAKSETHRTDDKNYEVLVHRKRSTRAFGSSHLELAKRFIETRQSILDPEDMGRGSLILRGKGDEKKICSCCHRVGGNMSRNEAIRF